MWFVTYAYLISVCAAGLCATSTHETAAHTPADAMHICEDARQQALKKYPLVFCHLVDRRRLFGF